mgnify:CR=1 FL=1
MDLIIKKRNNSKVTDRQWTHIEEKIGKLERYMDLITSATVEISHEMQRGAGEVYRVQVTLIGEHGVILRAEESATDLFAAIDVVQSNLQRQIKRYKEKHWRRGKLRRQGGKFIQADLDLVGVPEYESDEWAEPPQLVRMKEFALKPMFSDEAVEQMELLGHNFFMFRDADTARVSVVYRRNDGNYGLIAPDED